MEVMDGSEEEEEEVGGDEAMLWSIQEALERQTLQIGTSACGATAVVDVLKALGVEVTSEDADRCVRTRLRRNESPLPDYLLSRSEAATAVFQVSQMFAGTAASPPNEARQRLEPISRVSCQRDSWLLSQPGATHSQLIRGAEEASKGAVTGRFFHLYPRRLVRLVPWLACWIRKGAVPVATMNMQRAELLQGEEVPDAWHHQLIFGVAPNAVFMTNPLDVVSEGELRLRLCSESVLLIRREDVLKRLMPDCCLSSFSDPRWKSLDVEGQVKQMHLEEEEEQDGVKLTHITIPAAYSSGITLFALHQSELGQELLTAPELPLM